MNNVCCFTADSNQCIKMLGCIMMMICIDCLSSLKTHVYPTIPKRSPTTAIEIKCVWKRQLHLVRLKLVKILGASIPDGTMITMRRMMMPTTMQIRIFMSFHHICFLTSWADLRNLLDWLARFSVCSRRRLALAPLCASYSKFWVILTVVSSKSYQQYMSAPHQKTKLALSQLRFAAASAGSSTVAKSPRA
jgi:hypothetical protein